MRNKYVYYFMSPITSVWSHHTTSPISTGSLLLTRVQRKIENWKWKTSLTDQRIVSYPSTMSWSLGMKEAARWQFCRKIHLPFKICAFEMSSSALGPWPRPSEMRSTWRVLPLMSRANLMSWAVGSTPKVEWRYKVKWTFNTCEMQYGNMIAQSFLCIMIS